MSRAMATVVVSTLLLGIPTLGFAQEHTLLVRLDGFPTGADDFVESMQRELGKEDYSMQVVEQDFEWRMALVQETSLGGANATVVLLNPSCEVRLAISRSGRLTAGGALMLSRKN